MGEGELKMYIDGDDEYPTICGTGMEDYFGGAWSFATQQNGRTVENTYCTPYMGYPYYSAHDEEVHNFYHNDDAPPMRGFYRWHILDPIRFHEDFKVTVQQIGVYKKACSSVKTMWPRLPTGTRRSRTSRSGRWRPRKSVGLDKAQAEIKRR